MRRARQHPTLWVVELCDTIPETLLPALNRIAAEVGGCVGRDLRNPIEFTFSSPACAGRFVVALIRERIVGIALKDVREKGG